MVLCLRVARSIVAPGWKPRGLESRVCWSEEGHCASLGGAHRRAPRATMGGGPDKVFHACLRQPLRF